MIKDNKTNKTHHSFLFPRSSQKGFTIIELILVVAIILIVASLSVPIYSRFLLQNSVANTVDQLTGSLRKAQIYSMEGKQGSGWAVNYSSNTITLYLGSVFAGHNSAFDETYTINPNVSVSGITDISFSKITGLATPTSSTITISGGGNSKTLTVNNPGMVDR